MKDTSITNITELTVLYRGRTVGLLKQLSSGEIGFQYDNAWLSDGFSISPLSLPLSDRVFISHSPHFEGLYGVFYDCMPDGWGIRLLIRMFSERGIDYLRLPPLVKLALISGNGLGGLEFRPCINDMPSTEQQTLDELAQEADIIMHDKTDNKKSLDALYLLGGSSGGARPKAHLTIDGREWIVKFPGSMDGKDAGLKEYQANALAVDSGINTNNFRLFPSSICSGYFGAERFDRNNAGRVHVISLSSTLETSHRIPNLDYIHLFQVTSRICSNKDELYEVYRRMCFNVLYGNKDDHGKNFSFLYDEATGCYTLSPFYDITKTIDKAEHEMTVNGNGKPSDSDLVNIISVIGLNRSKCLDILDKISSVVK